MFISEIAERIKKEIGKFKSEAERVAAYQSIDSDVWLDNSLTELERDISIAFLKELVSVGILAGDFDKSSSFFCKNNVTGEEKEFHSLSEWSECLRGRAATQIVSPSGDRSGNMK